MGIGGIMEKLTEIQRNLKAPKGQYNTFGKYNYRSCEDILEAVKPLLNGCQLTLSDAIIEVGGRYYVEATAKISDGENEVSVTAYAREQETKKGMDESQITGSASSYARKYALNGLFLIDDTKDADAMDNTKKESNGKDAEKKHNAGEMTIKQWNAIKKIGHDTEELTEDEVKQMVKWKAEKEGIKPRHWKITKFFLPKEKFSETFAEYNEAMSEDIPY